MTSKRAGVVTYTMVWFFCLWAMAMGSVSAEEKSRMAFVHLVDAWGRHQLIVLHRFDSTQLNKTFAELKQEQMKLYDRAKKNPAQEPPPLVHQRADPASREDVDSLEMNGRTTSSITARFGESRGNLKEGELDGKAAPNAVAKKISRPRVLLSRSFSLDAKVAQELKQALPAAADPTTLKIEGVSSTLL